MTRKALLGSAFFCWLLAAAAVSAGTTGNSCKPGTIHRSDQVTRVYDGDTVRTWDGTRIRLIGINTPENAYKQRPQQPLAHQAQAYLAQLLASTGNRVQLQIGQPPRDRYRRLLAHIYLTDGRSVSEAMLRKGLAFHVVFPPNLANLECYRRAELYARKKKLGIWGHPYYRPLPAGKITRRHTGFRRVSGRINDIRNKQGHRLLILGKRLQLFIHRRDIRYFRASRLNRLLNRRVVASGWISKRRGQLQMRVRHPYALDISKQK